VTVEPGPTSVNDPSASGVEQTVGGKDPVTAREDRPQEAVEAVRRLEENPPQGFDDETQYRAKLITSALGAPTFPATREALLDVARGRGAQDAVISDLKSLPDGASYDTYDELLVALGIGTFGRVDVPGAPPRDPEGGAPSLPR
jgi:hypothetical protein